MMLLNCMSFELFPRSLFWDGVTYVECNNEFAFHNNFPYTHGMFFVHNTTHPCTFIEIKYVQSKEKKMYLCLLIILKTPRWYWGWLFYISDIHFYKWKFKKKNIFSFYGIICNYFILPFFLSHKLVNNNNNNMNIKEQITDTER